MPLESLKVIGVVDLLPRSTMSKIQTIPNLMHQVRILTNYVSSAMLRLKQLEIRNIMTLKIHKKKNQNRDSWKGAKSAEG
jgi:hypothetical protein